MKILLLLEALSAVCLAPGDYVGVLVGRAGMQRYKTDHGSVFLPIAKS